MADLAQARVIVTGAATGIGLATARHFHLLGSTVALLDINGDSVQAQAQQLDASGKRAFAIRTDVANPASVASACKAALEKMGQVDVLVERGRRFHAI